MIGAGIRGEVEQAVHGMLRALGDEVDALQARDARPVALHGGVRVADGLYTFRVDREIDVPADTDVSVSLAGRGVVRGTLVEAHDFDVLLALPEADGDALAEAALRLTPWRIDRRLCARLNEALQGDLELPARLLGLRQSSSAPAAVEGDDVTRAVDRCGHEALHFVWGPPGTGKTTALARTVRARVERGERVLVVAHANAAVDVAITAIARTFEGHADLAEGSVLRIGAAADTVPTAVRLDTHSGADDVARRAQLDAERRALTAALRGEGRGGARLDEIRRELAEIEALLALDRHHLLGRARVIATTITRAIMHDDLWHWPADAVVVDEAGMAPFPAVFALSGGTARDEPERRRSGRPTEGPRVAPRRLLLFGDFRQLAPVTSSDGSWARTWLQRDVFEVAGVAQTCRAALESADVRLDPSVSLLRTQHRMAAAIADVVSRLAYGGHLRSSALVDRMTAPLRAHPPWPGEALVVLDTSELGVVACRDVGSTSRINPLQALLAIALRDVLGANVSSVGIVTPYRAQARLHAAGLGHDGSSATVHRFQGAERDVMIVDMVDAPPLEAPSMLTGADDETSRRLLNVAFSRARGRLVVLMHAPFVRARHPAGSPLRELLRMWDAREAGRNAISPLRVLRPQSMDATAADDRPRAETSAMMAWTRGFERLEGALRDDLNGARAAVIHLPAEFTASDALVAVMRKVESLTLYADASVASRLEDVETADLRLSHPAGGFFAFIDVTDVFSTVAYVGADRADGVFVRIQGNSPLCATLRDLLVGRQVAWQLRSAAVEAALRRVVGRCSVCGEARRPHASWRGWVLRCEMPQHAAVPLEMSALECVAEALNCPLCKGPGRVAGKAPEFWLRCGNPACTGVLPRLEDLFGH